MRGGTVEERITVTVPGGRGLHARPALAAWREAERYRSDVRIEGRGWGVGLKDPRPSSLSFHLGVLQGGQGDRSGRVTVIAEGPDAREAAGAVAGVLRGPSRACKVCEHPDREAIDEELRVASPRSVRPGYPGLSRAALTAHRDTCNATERRTT